MKGIKQKELQEFWEWCGFYYKRVPYRNSYHYEWRIDADPNYKFMAYPPIDLNNLFKYAVPKMRYVNIQFSDQYSDVIPQFSATASIRFADNHTWADNDPALALYQAIREVAVHNK